MIDVRCLVAAAVLAVPTLLSSLPARALTVLQYQAQGRGHYIGSWGHRPRALYRRHDHRYDGRHRRSY